MSIQIACDECGLLDYASERIDEVVKPNGWEQVYRKTSKNKGVWLDLCPACYAIEEVREDAISKPMPE